MAMEMRGDGIDGGALKTRSSRARHGAPKGIGKPRTTPVSEVVPRIRTFLIPLLTKIGTLNNQSMIGQNPAGFAMQMRISGVSLVFW